MNRDGTGRLIRLVTLIVPVVVLAGACAGPTSDGRPRTGLDLSTPSLGSGAGSTPGPDPAVGLAALEAGRWAVRAASPIGTDQPQLVAEGTRLVELAPPPDAAAGAAALSSRAAAFDPAAGTWRPLQPPPGGLPGGAVVAVPTSAGLLLVGDSEQDSASCCTAALLAPGRDAWRRLPAPPLHGPSLSGTLVAAPAGAAALVVHLRDRQHPAPEAAWFDPGAGRWTRLDPPARKGHDPLTLSVAPAGQGVLLWSLWGRMESDGDGSSTGYSGVDVLRLGADGRWSDVTGGWPQNHTVGDVVPAGDRLLQPPGQIWCGMCSHPPPFGEHAALVDPLTLARTPVPAGPLDDGGPALVWTGAAVLALDLTASMSGPDVDVKPGDLAAWSADGGWVRLPRAPLTPARTASAWIDGRLWALAADGRMMTFTPSRAG